MKDEIQKVQVETAETVEDIPEEQYEGCHVKEGYVLTQTEKSIAKNKAKMANFIGCLIIGGFIFSILVNLGCIVFKVIPTNEAVEIMKTLTNTFGAPLGFVLGYYYGVMKSE